MGEKYMFETYCEQLQSRTLLNPAKLKVIYEYTELTSVLPGDMAELGVYKGGSAYLIANTVKHKTLHLFDSFQGFKKTNPSIDDHIPGEFSDTSLDAVADFLKGMDVRFYEGWFDETKNSVPKDTRFCFVHIDGDLYETTLQGLYFFYPLMVPGGRMLFDDYTTSDCRGVQLAIMEFSILNNIKGGMINTGQYLIIK
jgi:hypothetical protein